MSHADSLIRQIERQQKALRELRGAMSASRSTAAGTDWDPREILLHLLGTTRDLTDNLRHPGAEVVTQQAGGEYNDAPELTTAAEACDALIQRLDAMIADVRGLDDAALSRSIALPGTAGALVSAAPIGLVVRQGLTDHFDEHIAQLREALTST